MKNEEWKTASATRTSHLQFFILHSTFLILQLVYAIGIECLQNTCLLDLLRKINANLLLWSIANNYFYYPEGGKDRHATILASGTNNIEISENSFESRSHLLIPSVKITPQIFKKNHPAARKKQKNRFPVGDTTISNNSQVGSNRPIDVTINAHCSDLDGDFWVSKAWLDFSSKCSSSATIHTYQQPSTDSPDDI